jgi:hypothetical protein
MSRDFEIRSDDQRRKSVQLEVVRKILSTLEGIQVIDDRYAEFEDEENELWMPIHLVYYDQDGTLYDETNLPLEEVANMTNSISLHLSSGSLHGDKRDISYIKIGLEVARILDWRVYDQDRGQYVNPDDSLYPLTG